MARNTDIHLEPDRTRVVSSLEVSPTRSADPTVALDPGTPSISVGGSDDETGGEIQVRDDAGSETLGRLSGDDGTGTLVLSNASGASTVAMDPNIFAERRALEIARLGNPTGRIELQRGADETERYRLAVFHGRSAPRTGEQRTPALEANSLGELRVNHEDGTTTARLDGEEAALVLSAAPEAGPGGDLVDEENGGGELVVRSSGSPTDIHVHAQGEPESDYGVDDGNRPRIYLDGTEAALELGRGETATHHPPENGRLDVRTDTGESVLTVRVTEDHQSEIVFRWLDGSRLKQRGTIRSHPNGIAIYDAGGNEALRITNGGEIRTRKKVTTNATF